MSAPSPLWLRATQIGDSPEPLFNGSHKRGALPKRDTAEQEMRGAAAASAETSDGGGGFLNW